MAKLCQENSNSVFTRLDTLHRGLLGYASRKGKVRAPKRTLARPRKMFRTRLADLWVHRGILLELSGLLHRIYPTRAYKSRRAELLSPGLASRC
jgi:hypothetical protein